MKPLLIATGLAGTLLAWSALAAPHMQRVRGSIADVDHSQVTLHTRAGETAQVNLTDKTTYVDVVRSSLSKIKKNDYIGTATKKRNGKLVALEVVIFPESMRGAGEGHYPWDKLPDYSTRDMPQTASSMTNGSVASSRPAGSRQMVNSSMTNGNIQASKSGAGGKQITVTYKGGRKSITVPACVPVVAFHKTKKSALKKGAQSFVLATRKNGELTAKLVAVGKNGVEPPM